MAAQARTRVERLIPKRFRCCRVDHFPHIDAEAVTQGLELVDQRDVYGTVGILEDFARLGRFGVGHGYHAVDERVVERDGHFRRIRVAAADDARDGFGLVGGVTGVFALWTEGEEEVAAQRQVRTRQQGQHHVPSRGRICRALQAHELSGAQLCGHRTNRVTHVRQIRRPCIGKWGRYTDDDDVGFAKATEVIRRFEGEGREGVRQPRPIEARDVAFAAA